MQRLLLAIFFILLTGPLFAGDPYDAFSALAHPENQPRVLNTEDIPDLKINVPQEFVTLEGDFNHDGVSDIAISGLYDLAEGAGKYFLLVATFKRGKSSALYYHEYDHPIYLHAVGTTGEGDPKTEAFSFSDCWNCDRGHDVIWNKKTKTFDAVAWERRKAPGTSAPTPVAEVPDALVDASLKTVGALPEVMAYVSNVKKRNGKLGTRVDWDAISEQTVWIYIFEKKEKSEEPFGKFLYSGKEKKVLKRQLLKGTK